MCRVMGDEDVTSLMKKRMAENWLPRILSYAQTSQKASIRKLMQEMDSAIAVNKLSQTGK